MEIESFCHLVPHAGRMLLIDRIVKWDERSLVASCRSHLSVGNPLGREGRLSVVHALEYGAQAMAVHGGLLAERAGAPIAGGVLASGRNLRFFRTRLDDLDDDLNVEVHAQHVQTGNVVYSFRVSACEQLVAEGSAIIMTRPSDGRTATD